MPKITRTKTTHNPDAVPGTARVHWAADVAPAGNVTRWVEDEAKAGDFPEEVCRRVAEFYAGWTNVGRLSFGCAVGGGSGAGVDEAALAHAERLGGENEELRLSLQQAHAELKAAREENAQLVKANDAVAKCIAEWEHNYNALEAESARLVKELAAAQELLNAEG